MQRPRGRGLPGTFEDEQESSVSRAEPVRGEARAAVREATSRLSRGAQQASAGRGSDAEWDRKPLTGPKSSGRVDIQFKTYSGCCIENRL